MDQPWKCAGCGREARARIKPCDCPTMVGVRQAEDGRREQTWLLILDAAPELYEALRGLLEANADGRDVRKYIDAVELARAAVAKANGRATNQEVPTGFSGQ
jgi:hypothetical protein